MVDETRLDLRTPNGETFGVVVVQTNHGPTDWLNPAGSPVQLADYIDVSVQSPRVRAASGAQRVHFLQFFWTQCEVATAHGAVWAGGDATHRNDALGRDDVHFTTDPSNNDTRLWYVDWHLGDPANRALGGPAALRSPFYDRHAWTPVDTPSILTMRDAPNSNSAPEIAGVCRDKLTMLRNNGAFSGARLGARETATSIVISSHFDTYVVAAPNPARPWSVFCHFEWSAIRRIAISGPPGSETFAVQSPTMTLRRQGRVFHLPAHLTSAMRPGFAGFLWVAGRGQTSRPHRRR